MAKGFYNIEETAAKLGISTEQVRKLVSDGKLQQFRDRDKLMFRTEQVDKLVSESPAKKSEDSEIELQLSDEADAMAGKTDAIELLNEEAPQSSDTGLNLRTPAAAKSDDTAEIVLEADQSATGEIELMLDETGTSAGAITLEDTSASDAIPSAEETGQSTGIAASLEEETPAAKKPRKESPKSGTATGINVFEAEEVPETADPMAQTRVIRAIRDEDAGLEADLNVEGVGSGSGLLDLTREADETSLGAAELLDDDAAEKSSAGGAASKAGTIGSVAGSATGVFEGAGGTEVEAETPEALSEGEEGEAIGEELPELAGAAYAAAEEYDPVGSSWGGAMLLGVFGVLVVATIVTVTGAREQIIELTQKMAPTTDPGSSLLYWTGGMFLGCVVLAVVGLFVGKSIAKKA